MKIFTKYTKTAVFGGIGSLLIILIGSLLLGKFSGYEAKILIQHSLHGMHTLCNTVALASATILALLLTLLGISSNSKSRLKKRHYRNVLRIARLDTVVFMAAVIVFLIFNLPITESDNVPPTWFTSLYYISLTISSVLSAALIVVVLMLYQTIANIIMIVGLDVEDHPLVVNEDGQEEEKEVN